MVISEIIKTQKFEDDIKHKDSLLKERIKKQIAKIIESPEIGKPLKYSLKSERTIYIKPYRLIYTLSNETLILLRFEHRKEVYD
ncbi:type II toxin-antitoxin system RelE/ParE family toxin [Candidatus Woesearchaeota archaeon]|nr:type II toxin-antitoxin system RelE/ParE family toxin [Candidatus Woesearchaeota archaeon]